MTPRLLVVTVRVALALSCVASDAASDRIPRIGFLTSMPPWSAEEGFREGLRELGYIEGKNILIEWRRPRDGDEGLQPLATELVRMKVNVIVTFRTPPARAAMSATNTIPVVFLGVADALRSDLVKSLAQPNVNATGVSLLSSELAVKRLDLLSGRASFKDRADHRSAGGTIDGDPRAPDTAVPSGSGNPMTSGRLLEL